MKPSHRRSIWRATVAASILTTLLLGPAYAQGDDGDGGGGCPLEFEPDPFPEYRITQAFAGYTDTGYSKTNLWEPGLIPMGVEASDTDSMLVKCNGSCTRVFHGDRVNARWSINGAGPGRGNFVDAGANLLLSVPDQMRTLYLPPSDLALGEVRTCVVRATGFDECGADDPDAYVEFTVKVTRKADGLFDVAVTIGTPVNPTFAEKPCIETSDAGCDLLMAQQIYPAPTVSICSYPGGGMVVSELRPLNCYPDDKDTLYAECGTPPGTQPVIHNGGSKELCDSIKYKWSWFHTAGQTGTGFFLKDNSRSPLFCAVLPGWISVQVQITTSDGEVATSAPVSFQIHEPKPKELGFDTTITIKKDVGIQNYSAPHWKDLNDDGDALDPGETHFPVAFKKSEKVKVKSMSFSVPIQPMPGLHVLGLEPNASQDLVVYGFTYNPASPSGQWSSVKAMTFGPLYTVSRYFANYTVGWLIGCTGGEIRQPCGQTDNKLYVIHGAPLNNQGGVGHTAFELACKMNNNAVDSAACLAPIWAEFSDRSVQRASPNGFNNAVSPDELLYWGRSTPVTSDEQQMLNGGNGSCGAWARFFASVLALQGIDQAVVEITPLASSSPTAAIYVNNWTALGGSPYLASWFRDQGNTLNPVANTGARDDLGLEGQGHNPNPVAIFRDHAVVRSNGAIYDPSYGSGPFSGWFWGAERGWENHSLYASCPDITSLVNNVQENANGVDLTYR